MRYDFNKLEVAAIAFRQRDEFAKAIRVYLFMADGDPSLDAGYLGEQLGCCYEELGDLQAAKYWFGRAVDENPELREYSRRRYAELADYDVQDIVPGYVVQS